MTYSLEFIRLRVVARVAWIEFNRAPVNAFNREMVDEVHEAIATALADPEVRVLVIASAIDALFQCRGGSSRIPRNERARHARLGLAVP